MMILLGLAALAGSPPPPVVLLPPAPPIVTVDGEMPATIVSFRPGTARCEGGEEALQFAELPLPVVAAGSDADPPAPVRIEFRIDSDGRPLGIREVPRASRGGFYYNSADVLPAFAASRFRAGSERSGCVIAYDVRPASVEQADPATLYRMVALQIPSGSPGLGRAIFDRTKPPGSNCFDDGSVNVRLRAYPAFETIPQAPGTVSYSFLAFDLDSSGRPRNARVLGSAGNAELDRQSLAAVRASRFSPLARQGCTYTYWRRPAEPLRAPEPPALESFRPERSNCPKETIPWAYVPPLNFPSEFQRRGIEGWAILSYDVAPWGGTGNVRVVAAEPAAAFGEQARRIVSGAREPASDSGHVGCLTRVVFRMPQGRAGPALNAPD
ncbi:MAG: TonB family protein [Allosphingosinicella sp.]